MEGSQPALEMRVPPELENGVYANIVSVWHTPHDFTLDFAVSLPSRPGQDGGVIVPGQVVARVKISPSLVFDLLRTINENMTLYEQSLGEIRRPGEAGETTPD